MSKKDALTLACEILAEHFNLLYDCANCPAHSSINSVMYCHVDDTTENCIKTIKQSLQQQADIPDGWDVIRRTCKEIQKIWFNGLNPHNYFDKYGGYKDCEEKGVAMCLKHFEEQLKQAGIEVDDVCK